MPLLNLHRRALFAAAGGLAAVLVAGCASMGFGSAEDIVRERAQARWNALVERDWNTAYPYLTPGYRALVPLKRYGNQFSGPMQWESAQVDSVKCEEARCTVRVGVTARIILPGHDKRLTTTYFDETWVREEGQWYKFEQL